MQASAETGGYRDSIRATAGLVGWTFAWIATLALAKFGPDGLWSSQVASWLAVAVNLAVGVGWIVAFGRFLRTIDELERKILLDALVVALGVGWVVGFAYVVADSAGLMKVDVNVAAFPVILGVAFLISVVVGKIRYR